MATIDTAVTVTPAQRAIIEQYDLQVTEEFGHVVVCDPIIMRASASGQYRRIGAIHVAEQGRVHAPVAKLDLLLTEITEVHNMITPIKNVCPRCHNPSLVVNDLADTECSHLGCGWVRPEIGTGTVVVSKKTKAAKAPKQTKADRQQRLAPVAVVATDNIGSLHADGIIDETDANHMRDDADSERDQLADKDGVVDAMRTKTGRTVKAPKAGGVIGTLLALLADGTKRTREELYTALALQFPDRASESGGMRVTVGVQLVALAKKGHSIKSHKPGGTGKAVYYIG